MIWVLAGTKDAREIIEILKKENFQVLATAVTDYGASLAKNSGADKIIAKALNYDEMMGLIKLKGITAAIDATHPFATIASKNAIKACKDSNIKYIRYERPSGTIFNNQLIHNVKKLQS